MRCMLTEEISVPGGIHRVPGVPGVEDPPRLQAWMASAGLDLGELRGVTLIAGGRSNLTYRLDLDGGQLVLRRPPLGHVLPTAHDMSREYRVLVRAGGHPGAGAGDGGDLPGHRRDRRAVLPHALRRRAGAADPGRWQHPDAGAGGRAVRAARADHGHHPRRADRRRRAVRLRQARRLHGQAARPLAAAVGAVQDPRDPGVRRAGGPADGRPAGVGGRHPGAR